MPLVSKRFLWKCRQISFKNELMFARQSQQSNSRTTSEVLSHTSQTVILKCLFHVPYERNPFFTGREELLEKIRQKMHDDQLKGYKHRIALYGLGGVGKTQISLEYCFLYKDDYDYLFWLSAVDQQRLLLSFREIADILTEHYDRKFDGTAEEIARAVLRWLESKNKWLLIFDNLDDIRIADGYLPHTHLSGHVLITTRNKNCDGIPAEGVEINLLNAKDSVSLLLHRSGLENDQRKEVKVEAQKIVDILGYLPLAIEQAASFIRSTNIFEYLETYSHRLVQDVIRDDLDMLSQTSISIQVLQLGLAAFPSTMQGGNRDVCRTYYPQVTELLSKSRELQIPLMALK